MKADCQRAIIEEYCDGLVVGIHGVCLEDEVKYDGCRGLSSSLRLIHQSHQDDDDDNDDDIQMTLVNDEMEHQQDNTQDNIQGKTQGNIQDNIPLVVTESWPRRYESRKNSNTLAGLTERPNVSSSIDNGDGNGNGDSDNGRLQLMKQSRDNHKRTERRAAEMIGEGRMMREARLNFDELIGRCAWVISHLKRTRVFVATGIETGIETGTKDSDFG